MQGSGWGEATPMDEMSGCREAQRLIWTEGPERAPEGHVAACPACREEVRRAGDLLAAMSGMAARMAVPPAWLEPRLIAGATRTRMGWARDVVSHPKFWRGAAVGAAAAAAAAGAAFGLVAARRSAVRPAEVA